MQNVGVFLIYFEMLPQHARTGREENH